MQAAGDLDVCLDGSYCIGDKPEDIEMGERIGLRTILVLTGYGANVKASLEPDFIATDLHDAARWIQKCEQG
jgi:D-glycero-D-manno-heptose 1,7-bisphosphate phosphatase